MAHKTLQLEARDKQTFFKEIQLLSNVVRTLRLYGFQMLLWMAATFVVERDYSAQASVFPPKVTLTAKPYCCRLGRNLSLKAASPPFRCAICQVDQEPFEGLMTDNSGGYCSSPYAPWGGPHLCLECRKKKDAMEGKRSSRSTACR